MQTEQNAKKKTKNFFFLFLLSSESTLDRRSEVQTYIEPTKLFPMKVKNGAYRQIFQIEGYGSLIRMCRFLRSFDRAGFWILERIQALGPSNLRGVPGVSSSLLTSIEYHRPTYTPTIDLLSTE